MKLGQKAKEPVSLAPSKTAQSSYSSSDDSSDSDFPQPTGKKSHKQMGFAVKQDNMYWKKMYEEKDRKFD